MAKKKESFKSGDTVLFKTKEIALNYSYITNNVLFTFICEHSPQSGHCLLMKMSNSTFIPMVHINDIRLATEEEC
jgi:hypothetical protein